MYIGNIRTNVGTNTICSRCGTQVIKRDLYKIDLIAINNKGECKKCGNKIIDFI